MPRVPRARVCDRRVERSAASPTMRGRYRAAPMTHHGLHEAYAILRVRVRRRHPRALGFRCCVEHQLGHSEPFRLERRGDGIERSRQLRRALEQAVRAAELRELEEPRVHHRACLCYTTDDHALAAARAAQIAVAGRSSREKSRHLPLRVRNSNFISPPKS